MTNLTPEQQAQVRELVERVRLTPEEINQIWEEREREDPLQRTDWSIYIARAATNKVLNYPGLALIDREKLQEIIDKISCEFCLTKEEIGVFLLRLEQGGYIIPLAEALKGAEE